MILGHDTPAFGRPRPQAATTFGDRLVAMIPAALIVAGVIATIASALSADDSTTKRLEIVGSIAVTVALGAARFVHRGSKCVVTPAVIVVTMYLLMRAVERDGVPTGHRSDGLVAILTVLISVGTVVVLGALVRVRRGHVVRSVIADTTIVTLAGWLVSWVVFVEPVLRAGRLEWAAVARACTHAVTAPLCYLLVLLLFSGRRRTRAVWLISLSLGAGIVADWVDGIAAAGWIARHPAHIDALFVLCLFLTAAAFSDRSIATLTDDLPRHRSHSALTRVLLTAACLPAPALLVAVSTPSGSADRVVRTVSLIALTLAVTLRVAESIHSNNAAHTRLLRDARRDPLTGLPNRLELTATIADALNEASGHGTVPTLLLIGLDRFKNINDSLGHDIGDEVLRLVAKRLRKAMPPHTHVARIGGDEFVVIDSTIRTEHEANTLAARALSLFREPLHVGAGDMYVMASIGVAVARPLTSSAQELQRDADTAMCRAKESGGNSIQVFEDAMYDRVFHRLEIESGLHRALERRELQLYYQPILDILSGQVTGFEALMRWQMADGRIVSPAEFIPVAEDTGQIIAIGNWALLEALTQLRTWIDEGVCSASTTMSVNVSPRQLRDPSLISTVNEALRRAQVAPRNLWLEVTESVMISEPDQALAALRRLRSIDVRLAIDDFGTGYSSLSLLRRFPLQRIKIDRSFISGMTDDENAYSLVRTIVAMAASLNLDLVAEGLESRDQLRALTALGCRKAQGFLLSSPVTAASMRATVNGLETAGLWSGGLQLSLGDD